MKVSGVEVPQNLAEAVSDNWEHNGTLRCCPLTTNVTGTVYLQLALLERTASEKNRFRQQSAIFWGTILGILVIHLVWTGAAHLPFS
jgi:hypothetical protein